MSTARPATSRRERHPEGPGQVGAGPAQDTTRDADQDEREQRADVDQVGQRRRGRRSRRSTAIAIPAIRVIRCGVPYVGCTFASDRGSSPSRAIANADPALAEHQDHRDHDQADAGADRDQVAHPVDPGGVEGGGQRRLVLGVDVRVVLDAGHDQADRGVQRGARSPASRGCRSGTSRCGFLASSAVVATMSKPMNAKKTTAAPAMTPPMPEHRRLVAEQRGDQRQVAEAALGVGHRLRVGDERRPVRRCRRRRCRRRSRWRPRPA